MNKSFVALVVFAASIFSGNSTAANLAFAFHVPLATDICEGFPICANPPESAVIYVELAIDDPLVPNQEWNATHLIGGSISGFPALIGGGNVGDYDVFTATGTYTVDPNAGIATATLTDYTIDAPVFFGNGHPFSDTYASPRVWYTALYDAGLEILATPGVPTSASAMLAPVPLPAAGYLFITALVGLFGTKRLARTRQLSV